MGLGSNPILIHRLYQSWGCNKTEGPVPSIVDKTWNNQKLCRTLYSFLLKLYSCIEFVTRSCLKPLSNEQKSMFKSGDSSAVRTWFLTWQSLNWALNCLHDVTLKCCGLDWSFCYVMFAKMLHTSMTLWRRNDVQKFDADAIFFREIKCKKMNISMFKQRFQCGLGCNQVKYARITITHLFHCINTCRVPQTLFVHQA